MYPSDAVIQTTRQYQQKDIGTQRRLRSAHAFAQSVHMNNNNNMKPQYLPTE